jgi:hypothetical protein
MVAFSVVLEKQFQSSVASIQVTILKLKSQA